MNTKFSILTGLLLSLLIGTPLMADDTEIFVGADPNTGRSNVLLSLDTSGSMQAQVINFNATDAAISDPSDPTSISNTHPKYYPGVDYDALGDTPGNPGCVDGNYYTTKLTYRGPVVPYVQQLTNNVNQTPYVDYVCGRDANAANTTADLYNPNSTNRDGNVSSGNITSLNCPAAVTALQTKGHFLDQNDDICNAFNDVDYTRVIFSGNFLDFVESITDNNGLPITVNTSTVAVIAANGSSVAPGMPMLDAGGNLINPPWDQFFVESRIQIVKDVVNDIIANNENYNINIGLMRFANDAVNGSSSNGGLIDEALTNIGTPDATTSAAQIATNKQTLINKMNTFLGYSGTPLEETYHEGYLYFSGNNELYGQNGDDDAFVNGTGGNGAQYKSPVEYACQKNSIILLTDGDPTSDNDADDEIRALYNAVYDPDTNCTGAGDCMNELSQYMWEQDLFPDDTGLIGADGTVLTSDLGIQQKVQTHTIGFLNNNVILGETADASEGLARFATNASDLKAVFAEALSQVIEEVSSFAAPALTVNNFNRLNNNDELYYTLFKPARQPVWPGNIKKYKFLNGAIVDQNDNPAVDANGAFVDGSNSFWTQAGVLDGNDVTLGGFASRLTVIRDIYSDLTGPGNLNDVNNIVDDANTNIDPTTLGLAAGDTAGKTALINWIYGLDNTGTVTNNTIGDTLHTNPVVLTYTSGTNATETNINQTIYFGTNTGFLHAINAEPATTGSMEEFAYIPSDLLPQVKTFAENQATAAFSKAYGLDGPISAWLENDDGDGVIEPNNGDAEKAHLYLNMRRGGRNIYSLDVSDRDNPSLEWKIKGGVTPGFEALGQTWSKVTPAVISSYGAPKHVLIFAGGYDPDQDTATVRTADDQGNAIYIVDPANGSLLWRASPAATSPVGEQLQVAKMQYSIPSDISVLDVNADGFTDRLYVGDMGGQLWRFDIMDTSSSQALKISGDVIADLASDSSTVNNRRFYYPPSVSRVSDDAFGSYLALSLGSGKRANPKNTVINDKFYMVKDPYVFDPKYLASNPTVPNYDYMSVAGGYGKIVDNGTAIVDVTNNSDPSFDEIGEFGWSLDFFTDGEKVLSTALTADNKIFFTSYIPGTDSINNASCDASAAIGSGRLYSVSLLTGATSFRKNTADLTDLSNTDVDLSLATPSDRFTSLSSAGIPPTPRLLITPDDMSTTGTTPIDPVTGLPITVDPSTGYAVTTDPVTGVTTVVVSTVTGDPVQIDPVTGEVVPEIDPNTGELVDPLTGNVVNPTDCLSATDATLIVSKESFVPPICTAPVRTYWQRFDTDPNDL